MKTAYFIEVATAELVEHIGPMAGFIVEDALVAAKITDQIDIAPRELRLLMTHFKLHIPAGLDASAISFKVEMAMLSKP